MLRKPQTPKYHALYWQLKTKPPPGGFLKKRRKPAFQVTFLLDSQPDRIGSNTWLGHSPMTHPSPSPNPPKCGLDRGLFCHQHEVIHHMFGQTFELLPQHRILCCNADRAGIEMTLSHHDASHSNQWCLTVGGPGQKGMPKKKSDSNKAGRVRFDDIYYIEQLQKFIGMYTPPKNNMSPEKGLFQ